MNRELDGTSALLDAIYAAALDHSKWETVVSAIGEALDAKAGLMMVPASFGVPAFSFAGFGLAPPPEVASYYTTIMGRANLTNRALATGRAPGVFTLADVIPIAEREGLDLWSKGFAPLGWTDAILMILRLPNEEGSPPVILNYFREQEKGPMSGQPLAFARQLFPHLRRAMALSVSLGSETVAQGSAREIVDAMPDPCLAISSTGGVLTQNAQAKALCALRDEIAVSEGRLKFWDPVCQGRWEAWLESVDAHSVERHDFVVPPRQEGRPLFVSMSPLGSTKARGWMSEPRKTLVRIVDPSSSAARDTTLRLRDFFGLTNAEAEITASLGAGRVVREIASVRGTSEGTIRLQIKSALNKTGVTGQTGLAALAFLLGR